MFWIVVALGLCFLFCLGCWAFVVNKAVDNGNDGLQLEEACGKLQSAEEEAKRLREQIVDLKWQVNEQIARINNATRVLRGE